MTKHLNLFFSFFTVFLLCNCAGTISPDFEPPVVSLHTFRMLPSESVTPRFEIGLHILNPNSDPLRFEGIFYSVDIEGYKVLSGVSNDLPTIEPYSEANIILEANVDLFKGVKLISSLLQDPRDTFQYNFKAKLDLQGFSPNIYIKEEGQFNLREGI